MIHPSPREGGDKSGDFSRKIVNITEDKDIRSLAAESIGEIGLNNPAAITTLIRLLQWLLDHSPKKA